MKKHREVVYGAAFGLGAAILDVMLHAWTEGTGIWQELLRPSLGAGLYRILFLIFGMALGWVLLQKSRQEIELNRLTENLQQFQRQIVAPAMLIHTKLQVLLTRGDLSLSPETETILRSIYEQSQAIQSATRQTRPS